MIPIILILSTCLTYYKLCNTFTAGKHTLPDNELYKLKFITSELSIHIICAIFLFYTVCKYSLFYYKNLENYIIERYNDTDDKIAGELVNVPQEYLDIYLFEILQYMFQIYMYHTKPLQYRDKQHYQLFFHHFFTISLISISWYGNTFPYGIVVLFLHDFSDIFLDLSKIMHILQPSEAFGKAGLIAMNLSWVICRLICLPVLVYNTSISCMLPFARNYLLLDKIILADVFLYMLLLLSIGQFAWYFLILKLTIKVFGIKKWKWSGVSKILDGNV